MAFSRTVRFFSALLALGALSSSALGAADDSLIFWKRAKIQSQTYLKGLRPVGVLHFQDLFQLRLNNGAIEVASNVSDVPDNMSMMATFDDIPGAAEVSIHRKPNSQLLDRFTVNLMDFPTERRAIALTVRFDAEQGRLTISETNQNNGTNEQTMLDQTHRMGLGASNFITVSYVRSSMNNMQSEQLSFASPDFTSFVQNRPAETSKYIRPMLRDLWQEMLFAPEPRVADQVFGSSRRVDPAIQKQVDELLPAFNSNDFHARSTASAKLKALGRAAADVLDRMDRSKLSPEQNVRIDLFLAKYNPLSANEITRLRRDPTFLLDCLYSDNSTVRWAALDQLRNAFNPTIDFDPDAPDEARNRAVSALRLRLVPAQ